MKRIVLSAFVGLLALLAGQAHAAINIRQNDDGTADFVGARAESPEFANCVGGAIIHGTVNAFTSLATTVFVSPITNAVLRNAATAIPVTASTSGQIRFRFYVGGSGALRNTTFPVVYRATTGVSSEQSTPADITMDLTNGASKVGTVYGISTRIQAGPVASNVRLGSNVLMRGEPIFVQTFTSTTNMATAPIMLHLCPR